MVFIAHVLVSEPDSGGTREGAGDGLGRLTNGGAAGDAPIAIAGPT